MHVKRTQHTRRMNSKSRSVEVKCIVYTVHYTLYTVQYSVDTPKQVDKNAR